MNKDERYNRSPKGRARMKRYDQSEKGKAHRDRHAKTEKGRARNHRYNASAKGVARAERSYARRIHLGSRFFGQVETAEHAAVINAHIRRRVDEFVTGQQARAQAQGAPSRPVSPETKPRTDRLGGRRATA